MDPFSIAIGVTGLVGLTGQTLKIARSYVHGVKYGREAATELLNELNVLQWNLEKLDDFLRSENGSVEHFDSSSVLVSSTSAYRSKLNLLRDKLEVAIKSPLGRHRWPLDAKEHRQSVDDLRAFAQWIQFSMNISNTSLLSKSSSQVLDILQNQLETFQIIDRVKDHNSTMEQTLKEQSQLIKNSHADEQREKVLEWLSKIKHDQKHHDIRLRRVKNTGGWLIEEKKFQCWRDATESENNFLWCHGIQGSGKTILTSLVIDHLSHQFEHENVAIAYLYFDYREQEVLSVERVLASLLKQVAAAKPNIPQSVLDFYKKINIQQRQAQQQELEQALLLTFQEYERVFIVIDALDECDQTTHRRNLISCLRSLQISPVVSIFITSRSHIEETNNFFEKASKIIIEANETDLEKYILWEIEQSDNVDIIDNEFRGEIVQKIGKAAQNMFLLAALQIKNILNEPTIGEMEEALQLMPCGLDDAFEETMRRIQNQPDGRKRLGMNTLMWISHARGPLLVKELSEALAIRTGTASLNPRYQPLQKLMVECSHGLVIVDEESSVIRLVHYSVQEYFHKHRRKFFPTGEKTVAELCITYLLFDSFSQGCCDDEAAIVNQLTKYPFLSYAARQWGNHTSEARCESIDQIALSFLNSMSNKACAWQIWQYTEGRRKDYWEPEEARSCNELHLAALFGLEQLVKQLIESRKVEIDSPTNMGTTALINAASRGSVGLTRMLLSMGANPSKENWYGAALQCAAEAGQVATILEILKTGQSINSRDSRGRTALHCATLSGRKNAIHILLEKGVDVNAKSIYDFTALRNAVVWEQPPDIVRLLLEHGADPEIRSRQKVTAFHDAVGMGNKDALMLLLEFNADVNARLEHGETALLLASYKGCMAMVMTLLDHGAEVNSRTCEGLTPLYVATKRNHPSIVQLLLNRGADVNIEYEDGLTPLYFAMKWKYREIIMLLLDAGADPNGPGVDEGMTTEFAPETGDENIRELFCHTPTSTMHWRDLHIQDGVKKLNSSVPVQRCAACAKRFTNRSYIKMPSVCPKAGCEYIAYGLHADIDWSRHFFQKHFFDTQNRCNPPGNNSVAKSRDLCEAYMLQGYRQKRRRAWMESILGELQKREVAEGEDDDDILLFGK
ncbi:MAG: hypothetical protein Q9167_002532 [Letrouitia subvulpina]